MNSNFIFILVVVIVSYLVAFLITTAITLVKDVIGFNNGKCPNGCGLDLTYFATDNKGNRGYACRRCGYHTWITYYSVDRRNINNRKKRRNSYGSRG